METLKEQILRELSLGDKTESSLEKALGKEGIRGALDALLKEGLVRWYAVTRPAPWFPWFIIRKTYYTLTKKY